MTVRELIEKLEQFKPDTPIIMSSDPEGNSFGDIIQVEESWYEVNWGEPIHPDDLGDIDESNHIDKVIIFWP